MNVIERFRQGRKVKTVLPNNRTAGEREIGSFLRLRGENFWRRVNSDGTLTQVGDKKNQYNYQNTPSKVRNDFIRSKGGQKGSDGSHWSNLPFKVLKIFPGYNVANFITDKIGYRGAVHNAILRNANGTAGWDEFINIPINMTDSKGYYTGKIYTNPKAEEIISNESGPNYYSIEKDTSGNMINLYTHQDDTGFEPSEIGVGIYKNNAKFNRLPAYQGNYYNIDTLYLPASQQESFKRNLNVSKNINHDQSLVGMSQKQVNGIYDAKNFYITPRDVNGQYYIDMEDVFDLDKFGLDSQNYPFIINQRLPVKFTNDENMLKTIPNSRTWYE